MPESPLVIINVNIMSNTQNQQSEKLTHKITVCCTEDDYLRHATLSAGGKANSKNDYLRSIRRNHHLESFDADNPPPFKTNNEA